LEQVDDETYKYMYVVGQRTVMCVEAKKSSESELNRIGVDTQQ